MHTVTSKDGTAIAYEVAGGGPAVVLVGTTAGDHHDLDDLARLLAADLRVVNYDRRGRGNSGDTQTYAPAREVEDLDALLEVFMTEAIGLRVEYLAPMKADPSWGKMTRYAHTLAYDGRLVQGTQDGALLPAGRWLVTQPVEVVVGEGSEPFFHDGARALVELLPEATYRTLPGQDHSAFWTAPDAVASSVAGFLHATAR